MITPLGQRQILTTAAAEALRQGQEGAVQGQLLQARRQATLDRMTEAQGEVPQIEGADELRLNPDTSHQSQGGAGGSDTQDEAEPSASASEEAGPAEGHLNLLA